MVQSVLTPPVLSRYALFDFHCSYHWKFLRQLFFRQPKLQTYQSSSGRHMTTSNGHLLRRSGFPSMGNEPIPIGESPAPTQHRWPTPRETGVEGPTKEPSPLPRPPAAPRRLPAAVTETSTSGCFLSHSCTPVSPRQSRRSGARFRTYSNYVSFPSDPIMYQLYTFTGWV